MASAGLTRERTLEAQTVLPVFAGVFALILAMALLDAFLVRVAHGHREESAHWSFSRAEQLRAEGRHREALQFYRTAFEYNPASPEYQIALIRAHRRAGQADQAKLSVERLLAQSPADGAANIEMARILASAGEWQEAAWYYRRGLFGQWRSPEDLNSLRFELADLLAANNATADLQAEIALLDRDVTDPQELRHLGRLLIAGEAWRRAEQVYRTLLREGRSNPEFWVGLGKAQVGSGNYFGAERSFRRALTYPDSDEAPAQLALVQRVTGLDPMRRSLPRVERHRRAHQLASAVLAAVERCDTMNPEVLLAKAELGRHTDPRNYLRAAEADLDLLEQLWNTGEERCKGPLEVPEAVRIVVTQIVRPAS